jgi:methionine aminopeptidase
LKIEDVKEAEEAWFKANARSDTRKSVKRQRLEREAKGDVIDVEVDLTNINDLFDKKGQGLHMLEMEFKPTTETPLKPYVSTQTGKQTTKWTWRHKMTEVEIHRYKTKSGKSFDTGVLSQYLRLLKADGQNSVASECTSHILQLNSKRRGRNVNDVPQRVVNCESFLKQWVS